MTSAQGDRDRQLASDPRTPPAVLADLAARRPDLHGVIAANPSAYPALRQWIASVATPHQRQRYAPLPPRRRRSGAAGWLAGCGCLAVIVLAVVILGGGALLLDDSETDPGSQPTATASQSLDAEDAEQMAIYETERERYYELVAQLEGNPVAPLVTELVQFQQLEERADSATQYAGGPQAVAAEATERRQALETLVAEAEDRRVNTSGLRSEELIDSAGDGFIDVVWDAASACSEAEDPEWRTTGCVKKEESLVIHLLPDSEYSSVWELEMFVQHELAHVYQRADTAGTEELYGRYRLLLDQGMFQGSDEAMADCFALTYYDEWTLESEGAQIGYGYVCTESERAAIREWAAELGVVMPG